MILPNSITSIPNYAFDGCRSLSIIQIGVGVNEIGSYVFKGCNSLPEIEIPRVVKRLVTIHSMVVVH